MEVIGYTRSEGDHSIGSVDEWGVDFKSDIPTIYPVMPGVVAFSGPDCESKIHPIKSCYGNAVLIDHHNGLYSTYTHLLAGSYPPTGTNVSYDTPIGIMSDAGTKLCLDGQEQPNCTGAANVHLHFNVHSTEAGHTGTNYLWLGSPVNVFTPNTTHWIPGLPYPQVSGVIPTKVGHIGGTVVNGSNQSVSGAAITFSSGSAIRTTTTGVNGTYQFWFVPMGSATISAVSGVNAGTVNVSVVDQATTGAPTIRVSTVECLGSSSNTSLIGFLMPVAEAAVSCPTDRKSVV